MECTRLMKIPGSLPIKALYDTKKSFKVCVKIMHPHNVSKYALTMIHSKCIQAQLTMSHCKHPPV